MTPTSTSQPQMKTQHTSPTHTYPHTRQQQRVYGESLAFLLSFSQPSDLARLKLWLSFWVGLLFIYKSTKSKEKIKKKIKISAGRGTNHRSSPVCSAHIVLWNVDRWTHRAASLNQTPPRQHTLSIPSWHQEGFCRFFNICRSLQTATLAKFPHQSQVELMRVIAQPLNQIQGFNISWMLDKSWALWWLIPQVKWHPTMVCKCYSSTKNINRFILLFTLLKSEQAIDTVQGKLIE